MGRLVLRSVNAQVVVPDRTVSNHVTQVEYPGEDLVGAVVAGGARVQVLTTLGTGLLGFALRVRRLGVQRYFQEFGEIDIPSPGFYLLSGVMVVDLIKGDIIECLLGYQPIPNCVLTPNGVQVVIL